jgi:hypothetical protein
MTGATLDTGALIALESGSTRMAVLVQEALAGRAELAVPAGVLAHPGGRHSGRERGHLRERPGDIPSSPAIQTISPRSTRR